MRNKSIHFYFLHCGLLSFYGFTLYSCFSFLLSFCILFWSVLSYSIFFVVPFLPVFLLFLKKIHFVTILNDPLFIYWIFFFWILNHPNQVLSFVSSGWWRIVFVKTDTQWVIVAVSHKELGYIIEVLLKTCFSVSSDIH